MHLHKTLVVTTFNRKLYDEYAHTFVDTFPHNNLKLRVYSEDVLDIKSNLLTIQDDFVERNSYRPVSNYKFDSVRFCYKVYAIAQALEDYGLDYTRLLWIDADTVFLKAIDEQWITDNLYQEDAIMSYAGRPNYYMEGGLVLFNLEHPNTKNYINSVRSLYDNDLIYLLKEWHDCEAFDQTRIQYEAKGNKFNNYGVDYKVKSGHIINYLFGDALDHRKGKRKRLSRSPEGKGTKH